MESAPQKDAWTVERVLLALHRVDQNWPDGTDIESYWKRRGPSSSFTSPEDAFRAVQALHENDVALSRVKAITYHLQSEAIDGFVEQHVKNVEHLDEHAVRSTIQNLSALGNFFALEQFLEAVVKNGPKQAVADYRTRDRGSRVMHVLYGCAAAVEVFLVLVGLNHFESGFQTAVIASLGLIYYSFQFKTRVGFTNAAGTNLSILHELARVRFLLKDKAFSWDDHSEEVKVAEDALARERVRYLIVTAKISIITLACLIVLLFAIF